tara:strand:- start:1247 stop:1498 length:252 start_codon:yes stop_codon:yes gene_type:complete
MKSANPENEYIPLDLRISVRRGTLRLISEMARDMGISINEVFSFLAEDSVIDLELLEDLNKIEIPNKCSLDDLKNAIKEQGMC